MAVRRLYEPLCIAFGTTVSSPTVPTYQLYDLPHKFTPRLYMESEDPNLVLREIGVWAGWEQAGSANTRSFLLDLLKDEDAHDNFLVREAGPPRGFVGLVGSLFSHKNTFALCGQRALGSVVLGSNSPTSKLVWFTAQKVLEDLESDSCSASPGLPWHFLS